MKKKIFSIIKIILSFFFIPLLFVKIYHNVGILPGEDENGNFITVRKDYYYNVYENLNAIFYYKGITIAILIISIALFVFSGIIGFVSLIKNNGKIKKMSDICFVISLTVIAILLIVCSFVLRSY